MQNYNKEEVMKEIFQSEPMQRLMNAEATLMATGRLGSYEGKQTTTEVFSTALDSAYKAGEDARNMKIHKTIVDLPYPRDMYVARHRSEILAAIEALK